MFLIVCGSNAGNPRNKNLERKAHMYNENSFVYEAHQKTVVCTTVYLISFFPPIH